MSVSSRLTGRTAGLREVTLGLGLEESPAVRAASVPTSPATVVCLCTGVLAFRTAPMGRRGGELASSIAWV